MHGDGFWLIGVGIHVRSGSSSPRWGRRFLKKWLRSGRNDIAERRGLTGTLEVIEKGLLALGAIAGGRKESLEIPANAFDHRGGFFGLSLCREPS